MSEMTITDQAALIPFVFLSKTRHDIACNEFSDSLMCYVKCFLDDLYFLSLLLAEHTCTHTLDQPSDLQMIVPPNPLLTRTSPFHSHRVHLSMKPMLEAPEQTD